jgi:hypothetical protein
MLGRMACISKIYGTYKSIYMGDHEGPCAFLKIVEKTAAWKPANMVKDATLSSPATASPAGSTAPILDSKHGKPTSSYWPAIGTKDQTPGWLRDND